MRRYKNCLPPTHLMPAGKGNLVRITNPERRRGQRAGKLQEKALEKLGSREDTADFLERIRKEKPRYGADQMRAIVTTLETYEGMDAIGKALDYCIEQALYSAGISGWRWNILHRQTGQSRRKAQSPGAGKIPVPASAGAQHGRIHTGSGGIKHGKQDRNHPKPGSGPGAV